MIVLLITNKEDITTDFIVRELSKRTQPFYRLNTEEIGDTISICFNFNTNQHFIIDKLTETTIDLAEVQSVYWRRPEIKQQFPDVSQAEIIFLQREIAASLETLYALLQNAKWLNTSEAIRNAENKPYQLKLARQSGFNIPKTILTNIPKEALKFYRDCNGECVVKPLRHGLIQDGHEESIIFTSQVHFDEHNVQRIKSCPIYLQEHIKKHADIRVTVVGESVFAASIDSQNNNESKVDWRRSAEPLPHSIIELPDDLKNQCIAYVKKLNLQFGAIDFILDTNSTYIFLEINPNGQWAWLENRLGFPISKSITNLLLEKSA